MKTVCVYHSIDLDGWMSAAIVKHWFKINNNVHLEKDNILYEFNNPIADGNSDEKNTLTFIGYTHGDPIPDLSEYDSIVMVDISFPKEEMRKLFEQRINEFVWLDHHISAIKEVGCIIPMEFTEDHSVKHAACELTWQYFFPDTPMPEIVRLLGRYDCFGHKGTDEDRKVLEFQYASRSKVYDYETAYRWLIQWSTIHTQSWIQTGKDIYSYLCIEAKQVYANGFEIKFGKMKAVDMNDMKVTYRTLPHEPWNESCYRFICFNKERFNPINFGIDYHTDGYDGAACFWYVNGKWNFSLYNDNGKVDCSVIAKQFGGGGHKGAAGFILDDLKAIMQ